MDEQWFLFGTLSSNDGLVDDNQLMGWADTMLGIFSAIANLVIVSAMRRSVLLELRAKKTL